MSRTVFILGAGASKEAGAPLMMDFYDVGYELWRNGDCAGRKVQFDLVVNANRKLRGVFEKSYLNRTNIEDIFSAFEMGRTIGKLGILEQDEIEKISEAIKIFIATTLGKSIHVGLDSKIKPNPPIPYGDFVQFLIDIETDPMTSLPNFLFRSSIITFNYDLALEIALSQFEKGYNYHLNLEDAKINSLPLLKLHGSLNWAKCHRCGVMTWYDIFKESYSIQQLGTPIFLLGHPEKARCDKCGNYCSESEIPEIIPPIWNKSQMDTSMANVWKRAAKELSEAEEIIIIGYSLPDTDLFFRYLFALATDSEVQIKKLIICNPDDGVSDKFLKSRVIGEGIKEKVIPLNMTFKDALRKKAFRNLL